MAQNMKAVKLRMKSIQSTRQITNAMGLVAASKLRKAKDKADAALPAFKILRRTLNNIADSNKDFTSPYTRPGRSGKWCFAVIAGDRGLAGGYNANLFRYVAARTEGKDCVFLPIGNKAVEYYTKRGAAMADRQFSEAADISISECFDIARYLCEKFKEGEFGHIALCYTEFENMLTMKTKDIPVLPLSDFAGEQDEDEETVRRIIEYKPGPEEVFNAIVPEYVSNIVYSAVCESLASELAARRNAMDAATKNAEEILEKLELSYNRARQASITQEITEIVAGASD